jgi:hypothetical protein
MSLKKEIKRTHDAIKEVARGARITLSHNKREKPFKKSSRGSQAPI